MKTLSNKLKAETITIEIMSDTEYTFVYFENIQVRTAINKVFKDYPDYSILSVKTKYYYQ